MSCFIPDRPGALYKTIILVQTIFLLGIGGCSNQREYGVSGRTMGTSYHIKYNASLFFDHQTLKKEITEKLKNINHSMSTYDPKSEISTFNRMADTNEKLSISDDFYQVMSEAKQLHTMTQGAWDGTVKPLVNLWGFGHTSHPQKKPDELQIQECLQSIGFQHIQITDHQLQKKIPQLQLNLASIAKGFGVDQIAKVLEKHGIANYLVEIGGEVFAKGNKISGDPWRVGVNHPSIDASANDIYYALPLTNKAIATSGDYRNFFLDGNKRYSHVIDPTSGYPVNNGIVSVSVLTNTCSFADGLATALMVMGEKSGLELVNRLSDTECLIIKENETGDGFALFFSEGFPRK